VYPCSAEAALIDPKALKARNLMVKYRKRKHFTEVLQRRKKSPLLLPPAMQAFRYLF
jgi:hypothetical protein